MNQLPLCLEKLIIEYKTSMEFYDTYLKEWIYEKSYESYEFFKQYGFDFHLFNYDSDDSDDDSFEFDDIIRNERIFNIFKNNDWYPYEIECKVIFNEPICFEDKNIYINLENHLYCDYDVRIIDLKEIIDDLIEMKLSFDPDHTYYEGFRITDEYVIFDDKKYRKVEIHFGS